ncbi:glycoside hydrolase family 16 protein [Curtobacterium sp. ISL-83]|uniref:glycoside hydrolase family 16 protein n=1 Tax=Curtobacterium sp. ISL-83 TaxID=2819145 RepID=UPI001BE62891|nr:glycoside hydrolase family 16 protein [Curtobacterium sp. ISL-83]MBT2501319.1 glycoside hydrolase family 16 protein [Curtobacterium sp. ISL-83]
MSIVILTGTAFALPANAATASTAAVRGHLDAVTPVRGGVTVSGWAADSSTTASTKVTITVNGAATSIVASAARRDVAAAYPSLGAAHGFATTINAPAGRDQVCVTAFTKAGTKSASLGCSTVTVPNASPIGALDTATTSASSIALSGWAIDPDTASPIAVQVRVDGVTVQTVTASAARPDVGRAYPSAGPNHGFSATVPASGGNHSVCVVGVNVGRGGNTGVGGCKTVSVTAPGGAPALPPVSSAPAGDTSTALPTGSVASNGRVWKQTYAQDFTTPAALGQVAAKYPSMGAYDGYSDTSGQGKYSPSKVLSVANGNLDFWLHSENGQPLVAAVLPDDYAPHTTGRVSIRYKTTNTDGYKFVGMMWPSSDNWNEGEIDWPEADLGGTPRPASAVPGTFSNGGMSFQPSTQMFADSDTTSYHVATTEWDKGIVRFYWDGKLVASTTKAVPTTPFRVTLQAETAIGEGTVPASSSGHVDIDWISIWD